MKKSLIGEALDHSIEVSAHLAAIVESSDDAIISKTLEGIITSWNGAAERLFGYKADEAIGRHITLIIPPEREDEEFIILGKVKAGQRLDHFETVRLTKDGRRIEISLTVSPIKNRDGVVVGASKIARDITEQKATEEALREANRRKDEFLASVSHELRTPMNAIIGLTHILGLSPAMGVREKQYVETLQSSAESLLDLINNLLDLSRLGAESLDLEEIEFSLPDIVDKTVEVAGVRAREKNIPLLVTYIPPLKQHFIGDSFRIQQVLTNLLANAVKFTEHGSVSLKISGQPRRGGTLLAFEVADTGIGIPEEKLPVIFEKFVQADASTTRKYGGSGLGLSIAKTLVEKMGGAISVESQEGLGSTFGFTVPVRSSANEAAIQSGGRPERKARKNVLIVDDNGPNMMVLTAYLDHLGYDYDTAENGLEAVRRFQGTRYDVILMDVQMHDMDGFESTRRIRTIEAERELPETPIIAMTAHVAEKDKHRCLDAGMSDFIAKPFKPDLLKSILDAKISTARTG